MISEIEPGGKRSEKKWELQDNLSFTGRHRTDETQNTKQG
jgi:hypothetical protein